METPRDSGGSLARLARRYGNPLDWGALDRCLFLLAGSSLAIVLMLAGLVVLAGSSLGPYLDPAAVRFAYWMAGATLLLWAILLAIGLRMRKRTQRARWITHVFTQTWALHFSTSLYLTGTYTTPLWLLLAAGMLTGLTILDRSSANWGTATGFIVMLGTSLAERAGWLPYAPLFKTAPYASDGRVEGSWVAATIILALVFLFTIWMLNDWMIVRWRARERKFRELSVTDPLTGLPNRRRFLGALESECQRARRLGRPLSLLMCDLDHFKRVNDTHGHPKGDEVLRQVARAIEEAIRTGVDTAGRLGGEEFGVILIETDVAEAGLAGERIAERVRSLRFDGSSLFSVTISIGAAGLPVEKLDPEGLLEAADSLLYRAKRQGRDRVVAGKFE
ncbi:MAG: GGDEF domain-containing protein [Bdellovibrionota bacterium]